MRAKDILSDNYCTWLYFKFGSPFTHDQKSTHFHILALKKGKFTFGFQFCLGLWFTNIQFWSQQNFSSNEFQVILHLIARNDSYFAQRPTNSFFLSSWLLCQFQNRVTYIPLIIYLQKNLLYRLLLLATWPWESGKSSHCSRIVLWETSSSGIQTDSVPNAVVFAYCSVR